jgi:hypothetical protein
LGFGIVGKSMHASSNDLGNSSRIYLYSLILSVLTFFFLLLPLYDLFKNSFGLLIPIWIETPSIIGLYALYINIFDKVLWKFKAIELFGMPKIPNLNGTWKATIKSSHEDKDKEAIATICQNYSKFSMILKTDESTSQTTMASFELGNPIRRTLTYTYICKPLPASPASMEIHEGTGNLEIVKGDEEMSGYYYSGRGRRNYGEIHLKKQGKTA